MNRDDLIAELAALDTRRAEIITDLITMATTPPVEERLLSVQEAAKVLATTPDWLYRHARKLPFTVRLGAGQVRFRSTGIQEYLRRRT